MNDQIPKVSVMILVGMAVIVLSGCGQVTKEVLDPIDTPSREIVTGNATL